jgi:hypothetical protein
MRFQSERKRAASIWRAGVIGKGSHTKKISNTGFVILVFYQTDDYLFDGLLGPAGGYARGTGSPVAAAIILGEHQTDIDIAFGVKNAVPYIHDDHIFVGALIANPHIDSRLGKQ